jgi:hypothetical protein
LIEVTGREPVKIVLARGVPVTLHTGRANVDLEIVDPHGNRITPARSGLELMRATPQWRTDGGGTLRLSRVAPGAYTVRLDGEEIGALEVGREPVEHRFRPRK